MASQNQSIIVCFTCRGKCFKENVIEVFGKIEAGKKSIPKLLSKHLPFIEIHEIEAPCICKQCWFSLKSFHNFYLRIVNAYNVYFKSIEEQFPEYNTVIPQSENTTEEYSPKKPADKHELDIQTEFNNYDHCQQMKDEPVDIIETDSAESDDYSDTVQKNLKMEFFEENYSSWDNTASNPSTSNNSIKRRTIGGTTPYQLIKDSTVMNQSTSVNERKPAWDENYELKHQGQYKDKYKQYITEENLCVQYPSRRGKCKIFHRNYSYVQHTARKDYKYLWRCDKARNYDCPAKLYTVLRDAQHYFISTINEHDCQYRDDGLRIAELVFFNKVHNNSKVESKALGMNPNEKYNDQIELQPMETSTQSIFKAECTNPILPDVIEIDD